MVDLLLLLMLRGVWLLIKTGRMVLVWLLMRWHLMRWEHGHVAPVLLMVVLWGRVASELGMMMVLMLGLVHRWVLVMVHVVLLVLELSLHGLHLRRLEWC